METLKSLFGLGKTKTRVEKDSMGEIEVPHDALYGAQTERALHNFAIRYNQLPNDFIRSLALIKKACALANHKLNLLDAKTTDAICKSCDKVLKENLFIHFPLDVFQTGSGTSTNMNMNEVIARLSVTCFDTKVHPNDQVNKSQSSNDVIPSCIHVSALICLNRDLFPAIDRLIFALQHKSSDLSTTVKTGRTHLMDAMPLTFGQELSGYLTQVEKSRKRINLASKGLSALALGGTAVGTGINTHEGFAEIACKYISELSTYKFTPSKNFFYSISTQDSTNNLANSLQLLATSLTKICNDFRWMNSGPLAGLSDITLPSLQPGSSIMPGKVNPVILESILMALAQVMGFCNVISFANQSGNFQLNTMLPLIAYNVLQCISLLTDCCNLLATKVIDVFEPNIAKIDATLSVNPILVTALNEIIGYDKGAMIAKKAYQQNRPVLEVALEETDLSQSELEKILNPLSLTTNKT